MNTKKVLVGAVIVLSLIVIILSSILVGTLIPGFVNQQQGPGHSTGAPRMRKPSSYHIGTSYKHAMQETKPVVALFYANWCGYCMRFMPNYEKLSKTYKDQYNFVMINVEDKKNEALVKEYAVAGFPTVFIINPTTKAKTRMDNKIFKDIEKLNAALDKYLTN